MRGLFIFPSLLHCIKKIWFLSHEMNVFIYLKVFFFFFPLAVPGLSCGMWDPIPRPGIELQPLRAGTLEP